MSDEMPIVFRLWKVGSRTVTLAVPRLAAGRDLHAVMEWDPDVPVRLSGAELEEYRAGRDAAFREVAAELGLHAAVLEV
ncbi:MAG TPA: hypothetical protein VFR90_01470 [Methylibium sp.]|uniref:hypothetical protein n=1 Tax=Methylibium sp. TaxID=2067992 RepID=UPI002DB5F3C3|nr:hypothetical protein [Methylibium sp.]HEU4457775.1 hypothetical protein [Methylibium sp.]